ncbi:4-oxalocrotonate tautomerase [Erythrobacter sp. 3-20A1M]|uniref:tautomerase family protein n=1 Tax=Erythrobacter sp. 3-20A1M TaxID=2653850 RepID=UPI001C339388|nr:tautomerase family protein [Erythrobacter sp. 3-20A1M]QWC57454.1 4-oxalocrotonate tautomerase [Erythrobacter sp. 3-20A1M]
MPHIAAKMHAGRSDAEKRALAEALTSAVIDTLGYGPDAVSVAIEDVAPSDWMGTVYHPEIASNEERLFKRPGYGPLTQQGENT